MWQWIVQWILVVIASKGGPNVTVYSAVDSSVVIASKGGPCKCGSVQCSG